MINPYDTDIKWNNKAHNEMCLPTVLSTWLIESKVSIPSVKYKPRLSKKGTSLYGLNSIYTEHKSLLLDVVEIFFPEQVFIPSEINKQGTNEFYLFNCISAIHDIVWYNNIQCSQPRGYERFMKEINNAMSMLYPVADYTMLMNAMRYPIHRNQTIEQLDSFLKANNRQYQSQKVIKKIKDHFNITKLTSTKNKKAIEGKKMLYKAVLEHIYNVEK